MSADELPRSVASFRVHEPVDVRAPFVRFLASSDETAALVELTQLEPRYEPQLDKQIAFREAALREARLRCDSVVGVLEVGEHLGSSYVVRELYEASSLHALRATPRPKALSVSVVAQLVRGVGAALVLAHDAGVFHLGLSEHDVLVHPGGFVFLRDFSESALRARFSLGIDAQDKALAPELRRQAECAAGTDVYALGALLYRSLTGSEQPDEWEPRWTGMMMELDAVGVPGDALRRAMDFFQRCLAERPAQRFPTVRKMLQAFDALEGELEGPKLRDNGVNALQAWLQSQQDSAERGVEPKLGPLRDDSADQAQRSPSPHPSLARGDTIQLIDAEESASLNAEPRAARGEAVSSAASAPSSTRPLTPVEPRRAEPSRETRVLHRSSSGIRALSPQMAERIGPHPLEILARSRYQVLAEIGTGGSGTVYKVLDTTLSEILALKLLRSDLTRDPGWLQRFKREMLITRDLEHRNILPSYHLESLDGLFFFTMRYIDGETLHERIRQRGPLSQKEGLRVLADVGEALRAAHARGIIHRDFKSANIIIERLTEHPYLMDFGIAWAPDNPGLTMTGQGIGTPVYMAPEQAMGSTIGPRADIYSFGVVLYEAFGGALPFVGSTTVAIYSAQVNSQYRPLAELNGRLPRPLLELVERCLRPVPEDRPESMKQVLACLKAIR